MIEQEIYKKLTSGTASGSGTIYSYLSGKIYAEWADSDKVTPYLVYDVADESADGRTLECNTFFTATIRFSIFANESLGKKWVRSGVEILADQVDGTLIGPHGYMTVIGKNILWDSEGRSWRGLVTVEAKSL